MSPLSRYSTPTCHSIPSYRIFNFTIYHVTRFYFNTVRSVGNTLATHFYKSKHHRWPFCYRSTRSVIHEQLWRPTHAFTSLSVSACRAIDFRCLCLSVQFFWAILSSVSYTIRSHGLVLMLLVPGIFVSSVVYYIVPFFLTATSHFTTVAVNSWGNGFSDVPSAGVLQGRRDAVFGLARDT